MQNSVPAFFVPSVTLDKQEQAYAELASSIRRSAPELGTRIYSITFTHDSETWSATVGQQLSGTAVKVTRTRGKKFESMVSLSNSSVVLAIFPGVPFYVWHDGASGVWSNPFMAGSPRSIVLFSS